MSLVDDLIALVIILFLGFAVYMRTKGKSLRDLIVEIKGGFKR